ncbi:hypothetical protein AB4874_16915 [Thioclava sp. 15-R06ZXC-3]|uniref:Uncharacterized protein n=1 Tax=Thioclava arctica TaxID=3238301 RepID=A0ABV3TPZ1_9RHOB
MSELRNAEKQAIFVAGYYRSGTSALCGALADLGVQIKSDSQVNEANPKGFFESTELIRFDVRVLDLMSSYWADLAPLPEGWIERADIQLQRDVLSEILSRQFAEAPLVAVKHPHLCRLLPLYLRAAEDLGYAPKVIHTHRAPYAVATSQATKNKMTRAHALALWSSYITSAEHLARGVPRAWVHYPDLLNDADATVRAALDTLNIETPRGRSVDFITKALNRSDEADTAGLFAPLAVLVRDIEVAIHEKADAQTWDDLRARSADLAGFVEELGRSGNRAAPGVGHGLIVSTPAGRSINLARATKAHPVRPSERGDPAERTRLLAQLDALRAQNGTLPEVSVLIACPEGASAQQVRDTLDSIAQNWTAPAIKLAYATKPQFDLSQNGLSMEHHFGSDAEMTASLFAAMAEARTDYAAIINAGDMLEPDAIARFTLRAATSGADILYCDEIAQSPGGPWIRAKPAMSASRLLESCFVGDWVWYKATTIAELGGFRPGLYPGAEEQDMQIRLVSAEKQVGTIPEALFVRGENTRRDGVPLEEATESARAAIAAHLAQAQIAATARPGTLPGLFVIDHVLETDPAVTLGIRCRPGIAPDLVKNTANTLLPHHTGTTSRIVFLRDEGLDETMTHFLDQVTAEITPGHPSVSVMKTAPQLGGTLAQLMQLRPENHVAIVDPISVPSAQDILGALAALLDAHAEAGVIAPLTFFRDGERTARLKGPLLFGAQARIGAGYEALSPGPGGWLATTQPVDAVDGPVVMARAGIAFDAQAVTWSELCASLSDPNGPSQSAAFWTPHRQVEIPDPGTEADCEVAAARAIAYRGHHHHPAMTIKGSPLMLEGRSGLVDNDAATLITTSDPADDAKFINAARFARQHDGLQAGIVSEPIDALSVLRARQQGRRWVRINPTSRICHPGTVSDIPSDLSVWSTLPPTERRPLVLSADRNVVTSRGLAARLRGMGARNVELRVPRLNREAWAAFTPKPAREKPVALWVEEAGIEVPWIEQAIAQTADRVAWTLVTRTKRDLPGNVAWRAIPIFEEDWVRLFSETGASVLLRPTPGANWCDDYLIRVALAGGCRVIAGREAEIPPEIAALVTKRLSSDGVARWVSALQAITETGPDSSARERLLEMPETWMEAGGDSLATLLSGGAREDHTDAA